MLFTYTFGEKLDLTEFRKQAAHYLGNMREITYHIYLPHYKMVVEAATIDNSTAHIVTIYMTDIRRDHDGEIIKEENIYPLLDTRFKESKDIQAIFTLVYYYRGSFVSNSTKESADKLCQLIKLIHKLNHLKAFL